MMRLALTLLLCACVGCAARVTRAADGTISTELTTASGTVAPSTDGGAATVEATYWAEPTRMVRTASWAELKAWHIAKAREADAKARSKAPPLDPYAGVKDRAEAGFAEVGQ